MTIIITTSPTGVTYEVDQDKTVSEGLYALTDILAKIEQQVSKKVSDEAYKMGLDSSFNMEKYADRRFKEITFKELK